MITNKPFKPILRAYGKFSPLFILVFFISLFFGKKLIPFGGNFLGGYDAAEYFYWHEFFIKEQILSGSLPLWNPYYYAGHPFAANPQTFLFYPATLIFVIFPLPWAFNIDIILHFCLAAFGMYYFTYVLTESRVAGVTAGLVYSLNGYLLSNLFAGHLTIIHTAAILPWIFYFTEKGLKYKSNFNFLMAGVVFGGQILGGEPQINYYTAIFLILYYFCRVIDISRLTKFNFKNLFLYGACFFIILITAFGISAIQIFPSLEFSTLCDRANDTLKFTSSFSLPHRDLFNFLIPKPSRMEYGCYMGIFSIFLAGIGLFTSGNTFRKLYLSLFISIAFTITMGNYTPFFKLYYKWLPGFKLFRFHARCMVIVVFFVAVFSGMGARKISDLKLSIKQNKAILSGFVAITILLYVGAKSVGISLTSKEMVIGYVMVFVTFVALNLIRFSKNSLVISALIVIPLFFDLYLSLSSRIPPLLNAEDKYFKEQVYEHRIIKDKGLYRVYVPITSMKGMKYHYYNIDAYTPIVLNDYYRFINYMAGIDELPVSRYKLSSQISDGDRAFRLKILGVKYGLVATHSGYQLKMARNVMPRAVLVKKAVVLPEIEDHLSYIKNERFNPEKEVVLTSLPKGFKMDGKSEVIDNEGVSIVKYEPNRIEIEATAKTDAFLVLCELFYPGWKAYVDDKEVQVLRADYLLRAVLLKPGSHHICFVYRPVSFLAGAYITLIFLCGIIGFILIRYIKQGFSYANFLN